MKKHFVILFHLLILIPTAMLAQSDSVQKIRDSYSSIWIFNGYSKSLNSFTLPVSPINFQFTTLFHNRMNMKWKLKKFTSALEVRNLLYWGDAPKFIPNFRNQLKNPNELAHLSSSWVIQKNAVMFTNIERLWGEYRIGKWTVKAGRQRINWSMNNTWNPNDIFNSYNLLDFDYEERIGVDGIRIHHQNSELSGFEVATSRNGSSKKITAAVKYHFNKNKYDWQILTGIYNSSFTAGIGWQGSIKEIGFKGESQFFKKENSSDIILNSGVEFDYITKKSWCLFGGMMYNQLGIVKPLDDWSGLSFNNTPQHIMPTRWNVITGLNKEFSPIINGRFSFIYTPVTNLVIIFPSLSVNIITNIDVDIFWQSFFAPKLGVYKGLGHTGFIRGKYSF